MERGWHEGSKSQQETGKRIQRQSKRMVRDIKRKNLKTAIASRHDLFSREVDSKRHSIRIEKG
jgi:hypothetical protein